MKIKERIIERVLGILDEIQDKTFKIEKITGNRVDWFDVIKKAKKEIEKLVKVEKIK